MAYKAQIHKTVGERVWEKVDKAGPIPPRYPHLGSCWLWTAYRDKKGYGRLAVATYPNGHYKAKLSFAHRLAWELAYEQIPGNLWVLHHCDTPACVNPNHLFLGTPQANNEDRHKKGGYANQAHGEGCGQHKLTREQVLEIRRICIPGKNWQSSENSFSDLARRFGVSYDAVRLAYLGKNWRHI